MLPLFNQSLVPKHLHRAYRMQTSLMTVVILCLTAYTNITCADVLKSAPWSAGSSIKHAEYLKNNSKEKGVSQSATITQSLFFSHGLDETFDMGVFVRDTYQNSEDQSQYWDNSNELGYGLEIIKPIQTRFISWGNISLQVLQRHTKHNDDIGKPFDSKLNEIKLQLNMSGDWLQ